MPISPALPDHLKGPQAVGLRIGEPIAQFEIGAYKNLVYLVLDWDTREAAWVDPQSDLSAPLQALTAHGFRLGKVLLTHTHWDHVAGVPELLRKFPEAELLLHEEDASRLDPEERNFPGLRLLKDGERISLGRLEIEALHTPGHSAGECCFFLPGCRPPYLLTGDTVFIRDCGRTDLPTGNTQEMFKSLQRIRRLPPETVILPGHHYREEVASTIAKELETSPPFQCHTSEELEALP